MSGEVASILDVLVRHMQSRGGLAAPQGQLLCKCVVILPASLRSSAPLSGVSCLSVQVCGSVSANCGQHMVTHSGPGNTEDSSGIQRTVADPASTRSEF